MPYPLHDLSASRTVMLYDNLQNIQPVLPAAYTAASILNCPMPPQLLLS